MDLSKLPKLSKSQPPPDAPATANPGVPIPSDVAESRNIAARTVPLTGLAEGWISVALGIILLLLYPNTIKYLHSRETFEQTNPITDGQGNPLHYTKSAFFWSDLGVTFFALVLIVEGIVLAFARRRGLVLATFALTVFGGIFNLGAVIYVYSLIGLPIVCALAIAVCGYMAIVQWSLFVSLSRR
jgi:hypothetical protein